MPDGRGKGDSKMETEIRIMQWQAKELQRLPGVSRAGGGKEQILP